MTITPTKKQKDVVDLTDKGHFVVLGTAGSGKTTMAILRAVYLAKLHPNEKVLLLTYNKALISYMNALESSFPENVKAENSG
jgi:superfamily I DNA and RNA helicase